MEFDTFSLVLLEAPPDRPSLGAASADALQDAHLNFMATAHEAGSLPAAGPVTGTDDPSLRGVCLHRMPAEEARALHERDPLVRAGQLRIRVFSWTVPGGAVLFGPARFPHSQSEAGGPG